MAKLIKVSGLNKAIKTLHSLDLDVTLSLAYHGMIHGNIEALVGFNEDVVKRLHKDYKALIPASWNKKDKQWSFNKTKAVKLQGKFSLVFQQATFEEFCDAVCLENDKTDKVEKTDQEKRDAAIKSVNTALVKALSMGIDKDTLALILKTAQAK